MDVVREYTNRCFQYVVLCALFPPNNHKKQNMFAKYEQHMDKLDRTGLSFPMLVKDILTGLRSVMARA